jgi:formylglycine-generating enzyme
MLPVDAAAPPSAMAEDVALPPAVLYLPDGGDVALGSEFVGAKSCAIESEPSPVNRRCPSEMVDVGGAFCIDRYEAQLIDKASGEPLSPYYPPDQGRGKDIQSHWEKLRAQCDIALGRGMALPELPAFQLEGKLEPMATSKGQVVPNGYLDANTAQQACERAGKRLCTATEWVTACRGQQNRQFPYGGQYVHGACNVFRDAHPAAVLHGNASEGHLDPRLNLVEADGGPLLRQTGTTPRCKSEWGTDAIYDMVGNLDEWVDDAQGAFHGGFYSRSTRLGCDARISTHPRQYLDYSLGVRCCR